MGKADLDEGTAEPGSAADKVTDTIARGIRSGIFVPGQHLVEPDLTRMLKISRGTLREGLKHLAANGIVTLNRFRGAYICALDRQTALDLLDTLEPMSCFGARIAAKNCNTNALRKAMTDAAVNLEQAGLSGHFGRYMECRRIFHDTMLEIAGNLELIRVMPLSRAELLRAQLETIQTDTQRRKHVAGYFKIAAAIASQHADDASEAMREHLSNTRRAVEELPNTAFPVGMSGML